MKKFLNALIMGAALNVLSQAHAAEIVYTITIPGAFTAANVTGTITTNGALGTLSTSDITAWDITASYGSVTEHFSNIVASPFTSSGFSWSPTSTLVASSSGLSFSNNANLSIYQSYFVGGIGKTDFISAFTYRTGSFSIHGSTGFAGATLSQINQSNFATVPNQSPVPEPKTYAMLLSGLGLIGFVAIRKRRNGNDIASFA